MLWQIITATWKQLLLSLILPCQVTLFYLDANTLQLPFVEVVVHGSPVNIFHSLGGENRCICLQKMLQALAAGDGQQAVRSNLYGQAGLLQGDVFTEHEMNIFAQRQIIAYNGDFSSRFEAWMIISKVSWSTHDVHLLSKVIQDFLAVLLCWKVLRCSNVHALSLSLLIKTGDRLCCYICICGIVLSKSFLSGKLFFDLKEERKEGAPMPIIQVLNYYLAILQHWQGF